VQGVEDRLRIKERLVLPLELQHFFQGESDMTLERVILGWLGADRALYCSQACALRAGQHEAQPVDEDDFDALNEIEDAPIGAACPVCGTGYRVDWSEHDAE
jgi:hypothetical protein